MSIISLFFKSYSEYVVGHWIKIGNHIYEQ